MSNNVQHPQHYNAHPAGIECIEVIRHYTCDIANAIKYLWRAGLKPEQGMDDAEKEIEDLKKALFYIDDYRRNCADETCAEVARGDMRYLVCKATGHSVREICDGYHRDITKALELLLMVGLVQVFGIARVKRWGQYLASATKCIQHRIIDLHDKAIEKDAADIMQMISGSEVDGIHTARPACRRPTEPEHYDPLNIIIQQGTAYCLASEPKKKPNGALYSPCDLCALRYDCISDGGTEPLRSLCQLHQATDQEYYREVGRARYAPAFGTIEVVDEMKELELEKKRLEEEDEDEE